MFCPQCGVGLGDGATACGACGWSASRKNLWITIGCILAGLFLLCCGIGTWGFLRTKRLMEEAATPLQVLYCRVQVVNYAKNHEGALPESLAVACNEPLKGANGEDVRIQFDAQGHKPGEVPDVFGTVLRFTKSADGSFEVRSAGRDRSFETADDVVEKGKADEDLDALKKTLAASFEDEAKKFMEGFGLDVKVKSAQPTPAPAAPGDKDAPPPPPPSPPPPPPGGEPK